MEIADFAKVLDVHLTGTFYCCKAVWDGMRERNYGRIVVTTSSSGLFGNFGQANYGAAKTGMIGLMNVLARKAVRTNVRVNTILANGGDADDGRAASTAGAGADEAGSDHAGGALICSAKMRRRVPSWVRARDLRGDQRSWKPKASNLAQSDWTPDAVAAHFRRHQRTWDKPRRWRARSSRPRNMSDRPRRGRGSSSDVIPGRCEASNPESRDSPMCNRTSEVHAKTRVPE